METWSYEFDRVQSKSQNMYEHLFAAVEELRSFYELQDSVHFEPHQWKQQLEQLKQLVESKQKECNIEQKEVYGSLSKLSKSVDKTAQQLLEGACCPCTKLPSHLVSQAICQHLYRRGLFTVGERFADESGILFQEDFTEPIKELYDIVSAIGEHRLEPAISWIMQHAVHLTKGGDILLFRLHELQYLQLLRERKIREAMEYANKHFPAFAESYLSEIQRLCGCLLFIDRIETSPYADLFSPHLKLETQAEFTKACCKVLGIAQESPLYLVTMAGIVALPVLLKAARIFPNKTEWKGTDQLPVEVELGKSFQFHSIFTCPVSREQSTCDNPPMLLPCGHVLCQASIQKLPRVTSRFKCPYCPSEQTVSQCRAINF
ncbi:hypothetical protein GpartN1_g5115.t1 [Galdieria partita]|uniref:Uncharacterized protein n=1 Tax=Galdieria partita TaxID=83374 RepID=A0A9C7Q030_9RHOD|nr:hypothetical protein GpartN1_g5115.t1 [Galdieria partita]